MHNGTLACGYFGGKTPPTSGSRPREKNLRPAQNIKSKSNLIERIHAGAVLGLITQKSNLLQITHYIT